MHNESLFCTRIFHFDKVLLNAPLNLRTALFMEEYFQVTDANIRKLHRNTSSLESETALHAKIIIYLALNLLFSLENCQRACKCAAYWWKTRLSPCQL